MRAHLELSNSSAKDWDLCREYDLSEDDFRGHKKAKEFGKVILLRQTSERQISEQKYLQASGSTTKFFIPQDCVYISVLYSPPINKERSWLVSSFPVLLPKPAEWCFLGSRLIGKDSDGGTLYEWYALSGSQFKYYPKLSSRLHGTGLFKVPSPAPEPLRAKVSRLFGD